MVHAGLHTCTCMCDTNTHTCLYLHDHWLHACTFIATETEVLIHALIVNATYILWKYVLLYSLF